MQGHEARRRAEEATPEQLQQMLTRARAEIKDWKKPAHINPALSRGAMFNIFAGCSLKKNFAGYALARTNMLREFGEYFPGYERPPGRIRPTEAKFHQEPKPYPAAEEKAYG